MQRTAEIQAIGLTDVREGERAHLGAVFLTAALVSAYLLGWSTLSTRIDGVEAGVFSLVYRLPPTYWAGFGLLLAATITWYFGGETRPYHFLLVALWMGYLFVGPELMEAYPRGVSSYAQSWGVQYVLEGREEEFFYFPWLGFHYAFAGLADLTDIGHPAMIRIGLLAMDRPPGGGRAPAPRRRAGRVWRRGGGAGGGGAPPRHGGEMEPKLRLALAAVRHHLRGLAHVLQRLLVPGGRRVLPGYRPARTGCFHSALLARLPGPGRSGQGGCLSAEPGVPGGASGLAAWPVCVAGVLEEPVPRAPVSPPRRGGEGPPPFRLRRRF